ncbi:MAG: hypothetical protein RML12_00765 [Xanthomonadales bacterium]|nr:hypothetical protein [Xanthomonadales bacterium]
MALVESEGERRLLAAQVAPRSLPELAGRPLRAAVLGRRILVTLLDAPSEWLVYDQGRLRWRHPAAGYRPHQLALLEDAGQAALCGFAPEIEIIDWERERVRRLPVPVSCNAALWLPEGERLLVHAHGALLLLDPASGEIRAQPWPEATQQSRARLLASRGRILLAEPESAALHLIPLAAPLPVRRLAELSEPAWDLVSVGEEAYVAGSTGELLGLTGDSRVRSRRIHEAGISHLLPVGSFLLSASDDRSIALWDRPELELRFRSRAHEFLVNHLALGGPDAVWSASSDGELKRWRLPELLPSERIPLRDGEGRPIPLHALWIDEETGRGLAGSWNRLLIRLERRGGAWQPRIEPAPGVLYRILPLPRLEALVLLFIEPSSLALLDLRDGRLRPLPDHGRRWLGLAAGPDPERFLAAGVAALGLWRVERAPEGLAARLERFHEQAALGELSAAAAQASRRRWLLASEEAVLALSWESLGPPERAGSGEP